jgi:hypothetical protein
MRTSLKTTIAAAIPLASLLWVTPPAVAHDGYRSHEHQRSWSQSYRRPYTGRYGWEQRYGSGSPSYMKNQRKYNKAMARLRRQEREAQAKAYRRFEGDRGDWRYRQRLAEIDRQYDHKRNKVEQNWGYR